MKSIISSRQNALYREVLNLSHSSRERKKRGKTVLDGIHLLDAYLGHRGTPECVMVSEGALENPEIIALLQRLRNIESMVVTRALFNELSPVDSPVGVVAVVPTPQSAQPPQELDCCLLLEGIQDPGNLGSILRTAAAADCEHVLLSKGSVFAWSPRVLRAAMGAHFAVQIYEGQDLNDYAKGFPGRVLVASASSKKSIADVALTGPVALVLGNEGQGVSAGLRLWAHEEISIPMSGKVESLNVAAAAAVILFERARQLEANRCVVPVSPGAKS